MAHDDDDDGVDPHGDVVPVPMTPGERNRLDSRRATDRRSLRGRRKGVDESSGAASNDTAVLSYSQVWAQKRGLEIRYPRVS
jgi:hypothetical protein